MRAGVTDHQVVSSFRRERSFGKIFVWVETTRDLRLDHPESLEDVVRRLKTAAVESHCSFDRHDSPSATTVTLSFWKLRFQTIVIEKLSQPPPVAEHGPEAALVIDDVAYDLHPMDRFAALGIPLTFAILPRDKHSKELALKAGALNFPVILHLPMQPIDLVHNDPGGAGLYLAMTPQQLHAQFEKDVNSVPNIVGINNHMGSAFTEDVTKMRLVLRWVKKRGLFFLDSHTSTHSVVPKVAKEVGVPCHVNETFLDNKDEVADIEKELDRVIALAKRNRRTIAIGHYRRKHLVEALEKKIPEFKARGVTLVFLPSFYDTAGSSPSHAYSRH